MDTVESVGHSVIVSDVSRQEHEQFKLWLEEQSWDIGTGTLFPSDIEGTVMLYLCSGLGYNHTWFYDILPALGAYWGTDRLIHEVEFTEEQERKPFRYYRNKR